MNDRSAKIGVWAYLLFTLASFALARWEDTFESRGKALALFTFMTLVVGLIKLAVPILLLQLGQAFA